MVLLRKFMSIFSEPSVPRAHSKPHTNAHMLPNTSTPTFFASRGGSSRLGTEQTAPKAGRVRPVPKSAPKREGEVWATVTVTREHPTTPALQCNHCGKEFCGGASRIKDHIIEACTCETNAFLDLKQKLIEAKDEAKDAKQQKLASAEVDAASELPRPEEKFRPKGQQSIQASLSASTAAEVDDALAEMFYGCNISPSIAEHPLFKKVVTKLKTAPASYKPPNRQRFCCSPTA